MAPLFGLDLWWEKMALGVEAGRVVSPAVAQAGVVGCGVVSAGRSSCWKEG